jgi:hypothetical protein
MPATKNAIETQIIGGGPVGLAQAKSKVGKS